MAVVPFAHPVQRSDSPKYGTGDAMAFPMARPLFVPNREPKKTAALQPDIRTSRGCRRPKFAFSWPSSAVGKPSQESNLHTSRGIDLSGIWIMFTFWARR